VQLATEEGRVIGSLIEKQLTTPQQYPLTLNSLVLACNQSSNRDPVVSYDERVVEQTLAALKTVGLVRFVHPSHGRSVIRYRQVLDERLALDETELALLAVLLLRGPQTVGELRIRTERMASFDGIAGVETELGRLVVLPEPLVARLPRRPGQKEERWVQLLAVDGAAPNESHVEPPAGSVAAGSVAAGSGSAGSGSVGSGSVGSGSAGPPASTPAPGLTPGLVSPSGLPTEVVAPASVLGPGPPLAPMPPVSASSPLLGEPSSERATGVRTEPGVGPRSDLSVEILSAEVAELRAEVADLRAAFEDLRAELGG
jgi:uncharacterized protein